MKRLQMVLSTKKTVNFNDFDVPIGFNRCIETVSRKGIWNNNGKNFVFPLENRFFYDYNKGCGGF